MLRSYRVPVAIARLRLRVDGGELGQLGRGADDADGGGVGTEVPTCGGLEVLDGQTLERLEEPLQLNRHAFAISGKNPHYAYDLLTVPVGVLKQGENVFTIRSRTEHPMLEVLWPEPALIVRFRD